MYSETVIENLEAERDLLGAILLNNKALYKVTDFLRPDHFSNEGHARIFDAILKTHDKGMVADPVTLNNSLQSDPAFEGEAGKYLASLAASATTVINAYQYGRVVYDCWKKRQLASVAKSILADVTTDAGADEISDTVISDLFTLSGDRTGQIMSLSTAIEGAMASLEKEMKGDVSKVPTGIKSIDRALGGGMKAPQLIIMAGRPGMGKTALALTVANNAAKAGYKGLFFSLEMGGQELANRLLSSEAEIDGRKLEEPDLTDLEMEKLCAAQGRLAGRGLYIDDTPALNIEQIVSRARGFKERQDIQFIVVDHIQRMGDPAGVQRGNRTLSLGKTVQGLKNLAKSLQIPVIALSQLNRGVEERTNKRPMLSDLRESGEIEQEADVVAFLYRHFYYLEKEAREEQDETRKREIMFECDKYRNLAEFIVAKRRSGATSATELFFQPELVFFKDLQR